MSAVFTHVIHTDGKPAPLTEVNHGMGGSSGNTGIHTGLGDGLPTASLRELVVAAVGKGGAHSAKMCVLYATADMNV